MAICFGDEDLTKCTSSQRTLGGYRLDPAHHRCCDDEFSLVPAQPLTARMVRSHQRPSTTGPRTRSGAQTHRVLPQRARTAAPGSRGNLQSALQWSQKVEQAHNVHEAVWRQARRMSSSLHTASHLSPECTSQQPSGQPVAKTQNSGIRGLDLPGPQQSSQGFVYVGFAPKKPRAPTRIRERVAKMMEETNLMETHAATRGVRGANLDVVNRTGTETNLVETHAATRGVRANLDGANHTGAVQQMGHMVSIPQCMDHAPESRQEATGWGTSPDPRPGATSVDSLTEWCHGRKSVCTDRPKL